MSFWIYVYFSDLRFIVNYQGTNTSLRSVFVVLNPMLKPRVIQKLLH